MKLQKHILFVLLFILIQGLTFAVTYYGFGFPYGSVGEARLSVISEFLLALLVLYYIRRYASWRQVGYGEFSWLRLLWFVPMLLPMLLLGVNFIIRLVSAGPSGSEMVVVLLAALMTLFVGFAEETMFRGILLRGEMARRNVLVAMLVSAIGFSLLHSVNVLGGIPVNAMLDQLSSTLIMGLTLTPMALLVGNLTPLVIWHFLYDFTRLAQSQVSAMDAVTGPFDIMFAVNLPVQYAMLVVGWVAVFVMWRKGKFPTPQGE